MGTIFNKPQESIVHHSQPFLSAAIQYHSLEIPIIPCLGDNGKIACVKWKPYREKQPSYKEVTSWQSQFPNANIGLITGALSNITVVDIDSAKPALIKQMIEHFGDTPIKIKTPRGGVHLYYSYNKEGSHTGIQGFPVDIKANGGYVIAPPSIHPQSQSNYQFLEGSLRKIKDLPKIKKGAIPQESIVQDPDILSGDIAEQGQRNHALFKALLFRARECSNLEELEDTAYLLNETFLEPALEQEEVEQVIQNVWRIKIENRLYGGGERFLTMISSEIHALKDNPRAFWLLANLKNAHDNKRKEFAISIGAMSKAIGWSIQDLKEARDALIEKRYLRLIHNGGNGEGDANRYGFFK